ncbi:hypothetical protein PPACK8108_LOCUS4264 [Phakopsora pachyrhizi]|uniref:Uncharacterized protein n=1 Tax=Phakopsora pachyrhizi TaxID=170000 RepID=A0AAV0APA6_PHAPC|nr:hypothetical protein PPACK8108_LOCUS4264 [Phakopsora pachyrhizi]
MLMQMIRVRMNWQRKSEAYQGYCSSNGTACYAYSSGPTTTSILAVVTGGAFCSVHSIPMRKAVVWVSPRSHINQVFSNRSTCPARMTSGTICLFLATLRSSSLNDLKTFDSIPDQSTWKFGDHHPAFIYYCDNETVNGVEFTEEGILGGSGLPKNYEDVPIVVDMSSKILTRCIPTRLWDRVGVIFERAQKNMRPSGLTVVVRCSRWESKCTYLAPGLSVAGALLLVLWSF